MSPAVPAPAHPHEAERLEVLRDYGVLDTPAEAAFDDLAFLASYICGTPVALVSLVDEARQWFKAKVGVEFTETSRDIAFCAHAILEPGKILVVPDALADPRFADNPLVREEPGIRFYAGAPLVGPGGLALGTLCAIDRVPRQLSDDQGRALAALSREVVLHLEMRRTLERLAAAMPDDADWEGEVHSGLEAAGRAASTASGLMGEAMEMMLAAEAEMRSLLYRMRTLQRRPSNQGEPPVD